MKLPLSNRLLTCAGFVQPGSRVADIGCDHGYLSIYLLTHGIADSVIASDVNEKPLSSAVVNAQKFGVTDRIKFYLSDGVRNIPRDFDVMVCAGMGADTMISILEAAPWLKNPKYRLILQCQSKRPELRKYLYGQGYAILREDLAQDGKFLYPIMEVTYAPGETLTPAQCHISPALLASRSPLLPAFYDRVVGGIRSAVQGMQHTNSEKLSRYQQILDELESMKI